MYNIQNKKSQIYFYEIKRKLLSGIKKVNFLFANNFRRLKFILMEDNISIGKDVIIGKNVNIKTTDGGRVIIENNVAIESNCYIYAKKGEVIIKKNSFIGFGSQIVSLKSILIGENCLIAAYCIIRDATHGIKKHMPINMQNHYVSQIVIGNDVWLGAHCVVTAKATIESGAVIGANSVVTKKIFSYDVAGGVPAEHIHKRQ